VLEKPKIKKQINKLKKEKKKKEEKAKEDTYACFSGLFLRE